MLGSAKTLLGLVAMPENPGAINWFHSTVTTLGTIFGDESKPVRDFESLWINIPPDDQPYAKSAWKHQTRGKAEGLLHSLYRRLELLPDPEPPEPPTQPTAATSEQQQQQQGLTHRVFIVHGHDHGLKNGVARYIELLGLKAVILHEQPDRGQTVIEKFEQEACADFAVVLATDDDIAASAKLLAKGKTEVQSTDLEARARQNVIFELGYFVAELGRKNVMLVTEPRVEIPSDLSGVIYTQRTEWTEKLWKYLRGIGHQFNLDQIDKATAIYTG